MEINMKKIIAGAEYDTEKAEFVHKHTEGEVGDAKGFEECLFRTADGKYFLYVNGGAESKYPAESIKRMSAKTAEQWLRENVK